jgi:hypothetical protein
MLTPPEEGWSCNCGRCGRHVDLTGQFAYVRGFQAFEEAAEVMEGLKDAKKLKTLRHHYEDTENQGFLLFEEAYSALQEAFRYELAEKQQQHGVKMMISIVQLFSPRNMVSGLEASYWNSMMVEQTARGELVKIEASFAGESGQKLSWFTRMRWQLRRNQLQRELKRLDRQIRGIEKGLRLAHNFHPYRGRS